MNRLLIAASFLLFLGTSAALFAQNRPEPESQTIENHVITVSRGGDAYAKPDLGIMVMTLRSTAPIAEEAVAQNAQKAKDVESALAKLGYGPEGFKISSVAFGQAGGPRYGPIQPEVVAYEASQFVYVFFQSADMNDVAQMTAKTAAVIEALRKAGAVPSNTQNFRMPPSQQSLIIYTIKDSAPYERQALQKAIVRARGAAQDVAAGMGLQITGLRNVRVGYLGGNLQYGNTALEGLPYSFYSTKSDELRIRANATVAYDFK